MQLERSATSEPRPGGSGRRVKIGGGRSLPVAALMWLTPTLFAQGDIQLGAEVYARNCANQYCHGANGEAGPAPALAGRGMSYRRLARPIIYGVANTNMPPWKDTLSQQELDAVIEYVLSLQGPAKLPPGPSNTERTASALEHLGRDLFFDPGRPGACGSCHELAGLGVPVAPPIETAPVDVRELREKPATTVRRVTGTSGAAYTAVVVDEKSPLLRFHDLTPTLPVLRSLRRDEASVEPQADWTHAARTSLYNERELEQIVSYLKAQLVGPERE